MYSGRSRAKSPSMKRRRGSKSPSVRGTYGRGAYGFRDFLEEAVGPAVLAGGAVGGPVGAGMAALMAEGVRIADKGIEDIISIYGKDGTYHKAKLGRPMTSAEAAALLNQQGNIYSQYARGRPGVVPSSNPGPSSFTNNAIPIITPQIRGAVGSGAYTPMLHLGGSGQSNSLIAGGRSPLQFGGTRDENGSLIISFSEFVRDVSAPTSNQFSVTAYGLNPGITESFPLLSQFAQNFEEYEFSQLIIEFRSAIDASSTANASGNVGSIVMATNYNADADVFGDKEQMLLYSGGVEARITENCYHGVECSRSKLSGSSTKFTRATNLPIGDYKDYDKGLFQIAFSNTPTVFQGVQVGALYAHYTVRLSKPKLFASLGNNVTSARFYTTQGLSVTNLTPTTMTSALKGTIKGMVLSHETVGVSHGIRYTFPDYMSGIFDVYCAFESATNGFVNGVYSAQVNTNVTVGTPANQPRIALYADMGQGSPYNASTFSSNTYASGPGTVMVKLRVKVTPTLAAGSNWVSFVLFGATSTGFSVMYSEVMETASNYATNSNTPAPTWINSSGAVVVAP